MFASYLDWKLLKCLDASAIQRQASCPMSSDARNFCAVHQLRDPVGEGGNGGLGITSVETISCAAFYAATMRGFAADCLGNFRQNTSPHQTMPYISAMLASALNHFVVNGATLVKNDIEATSHAKTGLPLPDLGILIGGNASNLLIPSWMHVTSTS